MLKYQSQLEAYGWTVKKFRSPCRYTFHAPDDHPALQRGNRDRAEELCELLALRERVEELTHILNSQKGT